MAIEKLNTVQTVAEEFTDVASATNTLLDDNYIRQEDIEDYEVAPFGQNKFLISIIYMSTVLGGWAAKVALKLTTTLGTAFTSNRSKISSLALKAVVMVTFFADVEVLENVIAFKNSLAKLFTISREISSLSIAFLVSIGKFKSLVSRKVSIAFVIAEIERGLFTANIVTSNTVGLDIVQFEALYNGIPIEE